LKIKPLFEKKQGLFDAANHGTGHRSFTFTRLFVFLWGCRNVNTRIIYFFISETTGMISQKN